VRIHATTTTTTNNNKQQQTTTTTTTTTTTKNEKLNQQKMNTQVFGNKLKVCGKNNNVA